MNLPRLATAPWFASLVLHALLMVLLALLLRPAEPVAGGDPDRPVSIVLARQQAGGETAYFSESDQAADPPDPHEATDALPSLDGAEGLVEPAADLPGLAFAGAGQAAELLPSATGLQAARQPKTVAAADDPSILANDPILNAPPGPTGPVAEVEMFGARSSGRSFALVVDRSQSMGPVLAAAARELKQGLAALTSEHRFQIVAYNHTVAAWPPRQLADATEENKELAARFIADLVPVGGTNHFPALLAAMRHKPDVVYFLSDADPPLAPNQMRELTLLSGGKTSIFGIQFGDGPLQDDDPFMQKLARLNRGTFRYIDLTKRR